MKTKTVLVFQLPIVGLVLSLSLAVSCWSAESKRVEASPVKQVSPASPPVANPMPSQPPTRTSILQGKLSAQGGRVNLLLNQNASKVELFSGGKKLASLGAGMRFDVTMYLRQASPQGLTFHYFTARGSKNTQHFKSQEIQALSGKTASLQQKPAPLRPPKPRPLGGAGSPPTSSQQALPGRPNLPMDLSANKSSFEQTPPSSAAGLPENMTAPAAIAITSPTLGDFMVEGGQFVLQWSGFGNVQEHCVNIYLRKANGWNSPDNMTIAENVCVNGYQWQLPTGLFNTGFVIKIRTIDNALTATSAPFSILSSQPDLKLTNLHIQPTSPDQRDSIIVRGDIQNSGHGTAVASQATVKLQSGSWTSAPQVVNVPALVFGPNAHVTFSKTFSPPFSSSSPPSTLNIKAVAIVDSQDQVTEADEGNNTEQISFTLTPLPNLIPVIMPEIQTGMSKKVKIQFRVRNTSTVQTPPTTCRTWIEKKGHETHNVPAIPGGQTFVFDREVFFAAAGWRDYSLTVDYGNDLTELNEYDNVKSGRIHARSGIKDPGPLIPLPDEDEHPALHEAVDFWHGLWPWNWF